MNPAPAAVVRNIKNAAENRVWEEKGKRQERGCRIQDINRRRQDVGCRSQERK